LSSTALPIIDHARISTSLLLTVPDEPLLAVLQEASAQITPAVRVRTLLLAKHPIMCTLVNLTMFHRRLCSLLHTVLVTNITDRPVLTVHQVGIVAAHVLQIKQKVILTYAMFSFAIVGTFPPLSAVVRVSIVAH